jgi:electron transfer flavoprotein beta subunit
MNILVLLRMVPDVVEELEIALDRKSLDAECLRMILSESDSHALEEAMILKERYGGTVTALALEAAEVDNALYTALAAGADRVMRITGGKPDLSTCGAARAFASALSQEAGLLPADVVLTGTQAPDDLDGLIAPLVSHRLAYPFLGIVTGIAINDGGRTATVIREFANGVRGEFELPLPAVLGIQAAEKPPRYVPVAKVRAAMRSQSIHSITLPSGEGEPVLLEVLEMCKPEPAARAEILEGTPDAVAGKVCQILAERGLL